MMGVYIKGIKTPAIVKVHYFNGRRYVEDPQNREWREMVDIPPHGRLVDADALMDQIEHDTPLSAVFEKTMRRYLHNAPTIIPADLPKEET